MAKSTGSASRSLRVETHEAKACACRIARFVNEKSIAPSEVIANRPVRNTVPVEARLHALENLPIRGGAESTREAFISPSATVTHLLDSVSGPASHSGIRGAEVHLSVDDLAIAVLWVSRHCPSAMILYA